MIDRSYKTFVFTQVFSSLWKWEKSVVSTLKNGSFVV